MARVTDLATLQQLLLQGKGYALPYITNLTGTLTASAGTSGHFDGGIGANNIGTTLPSTLQSIPITAQSAATRLVMNIHSPYNSAHPGFLVWLYKIGTLNLAATGDQFTHDAATFPILRSQFGVSNVAVDLIPLIQISTATATTAPQLIIKNAGATTGYVDTNGNTVVGTINMTLPAAATKINTTLLMLLNNGATGIRDIQSINVGVAGSVGAANIWGMEIISPLGAPTTAMSMMHDAVTGGMTLQDLQPGSATSGSASAFLGVWGGNGTTTNNIGGFLLAVQDT